VVCPRAQLDLRVTDWGLDKFYGFLRRGSRDSFREHTSRFIP
jgi:hypothetical protein